LFPNGVPSPENKGYSSTENEKAKKQGTPQRALFLFFFVVFPQS
jgi:hypothetical protein